MVETDVAPTLTAPAGVSVADYAAAVRHRFGNPAIEHRTLQIAMDGSQKLPQRIFATVAERRAAGAEPARLALALAGWLRFCQGRADDGRELPLDDPMAATIRAAVAGCDGTPAGLVAAVFALDTIVPAEVAADAVLTGLVADRLRQLTRDGAAATVAAVGR
jgi:fructuronate reductase